MVQNTVKSLLKYAKINIHTRIAIRDYYDFPKKYCIMMKMNSTQPAKVWCTYNYAGDRHLKR